MCCSRSPVISGSSDKRGTPTLNSTLPSLSLQVSAGVPGAPKRRMRSVWSEVSPLSQTADSPQARCRRQSPRRYIWFRSRARQRPGRGLHDGCGPAHRSRFLVGNRHPAHLEPYFFIRLQRLPRQLAIEAVGVEEHIADAFRFACPFVDEVRLFHPCIKRLVPGLRHIPGSGHVG